MPLGHLRQRQWKSFSRWIRSHAPAPVTSFTAKQCVNLCAVGGGLYRRKWTVRAGGASSDPLGRRAHECAARCTSLRVRRTWLSSRSVHTHARSLTEGVLTVTTHKVSPQWRKTILPPPVSATSGGHADHWVQLLAWSVFCRPSNHTRQSFPILVTERGARTWSRCTGSQPAGDVKWTTP